MSISKSNQRNTFQKENYLKRRAEEGLTPENDPDVAAMSDFYDSWNMQQEEKESDPEWRKYNLEWDLRSTDWILAKVRDNEIYAQNLYAALCNNEFINRDLWPMLKEQKWSCSWRYAGGIIADMRSEGGYLDWYCSGIGDKNEKFVGEGHVTDEIRDDLFKLGWIVIENNEVV